MGFLADFYIYSLRLFYIYRGPFRRRQPRTQLPSLFKHQLKNKKIQHIFIIRRKLSNYEEEGHAKWTAPRRRVKKAMPRKPRQEGRVKKPTTRSLCQEVCAKKATPIDCIAISIISRSSQPINNEPSLGFE